MRVFEFSYKGLALGGTAIVIAKNEGDARAAVFMHPNTPSTVVTLDLESVKPLELIDNVQVVYNWNGDY